MSYNIDFLIAGLIFMALILFHYVKQQLNDRSGKQNRLFLYFVLIGTVDILFDLITSILIDLHSPKLHVLTEVCLVVFYTMQVLIPVYLFQYVYSLRRDIQTSQLKRSFPSVIMAAIMILMVLTNHWTKFLFVVTSEGEYQHGPLYLTMYVYALTVVSALAVSSAVHHRHFRRQNYYVIWEFLFLTAAAVAVQAVFNNIMTTSFGISLGISVLYLTINNPYRNSDNLTNLFDRQYFHTVLHHMTSRKQSVHIQEVTIRNLDQVSAALGSTIAAKLLTSSADWLRELDRNCFLFRISDNKFLMVTDSIRTYAAAWTSFETFPEDVRIRTKKKATPMITVAGIIHAESLNDADNLLNYLDYLTTLPTEDKDVTFVQGDAETLRGYHYNQEIERFLTQAIQEDLFEIVFQPVFSLKEQRYVTLEALSRLRHPSLGPVSPAVFLAIAEKNNLIESISILQFRRICAFVADHKDELAGIKNIKFNLSPVELLNPDHIIELIEIIHEFGLDTSFIQFEITESVATEYNEALERIITLFTKENIGLCLDDFGSGYANLNSVLKLPFNVIKLDMSLLAGICEDERIALFYKSILQLFLQLGYQIVSEGVETREELDLLRGWGVNMIQGYFFSPPIKPEATLALLRIPEHH